MGPIQSTIDWPNRLILATAWLQSAAQQGYIPDLGEMRKSTGTVRMVKPKMSAQAITRAQALVALGLTEDDLAAFKLLAEKKQGRNRRGQARKESGATCNAAAAR